MRIPAGGVRQRGLHGQVLRGAQGAALRGVPLQGGAVRAGVLGEPRPAGDGPALHHGLPDEDGELPLLPCRVPVRFPGVRPRAALLGVPPVAPPVLSAAGSQAG